jgi:hypothetical protein
LKILQILHEEVFSKPPREAVKQAFEFFGFKAKKEGDWSEIHCAEVSLAYRKACLKSHPNRGGSHQK